MQIKNECVKKSVPILFNVHMTKGLLMLFWYSENFSITFENE